MIKKIPLTKGYVALVDDDDYEYLMQWKWHADVRLKKNHVNVYAKRNEPSKYIARNNRQKCVFMHRFINKTPLGIVTDHINGNGLDNRKENLRIANLNQNARNQKIRRICSSQYKGVCRRKYSWQANIVVNRKQIYLGSFSSEINSAIAYNKAAIIFHGDFANLNKIRR